MREILEAGLMENSYAPEILVDCRRHMDASSSQEMVVPAWAQTFSCKWIVKQFSDKKNSVMYRHDSENTILIHRRRCN